MTASDLELTVLYQIKVAGLPKPETEFRFHPTRRWRFDGAFPVQRVAYEVDGSTWTGGRHTRGAGVENDAEKMSTAAAMGWRVCRFTRAMVESGSALTLLEQALAYGGEP